MYRPALLLALALAIPNIPLLAQEPVGVVTGAAANYRLRPGDVIEVRVWGQEEYSGRFQVNEDWIIQYPLLGDLEVRDLTVTQLRERLVEGLQAIFRTPFVTVTPLFRMAVLGEVVRAGLYTVDPTLSVLDVVALAGGPTRDGNMKKIRLLRSGEGTEFDFEQETLRGRTLAEVGVRSGDEIVVPKKWLTQGDMLIILGVVQVALSIAIFAVTVR
jgi:polysaccharide export outer membrane protein